MPDTIPDAGNEVEATQQALAAAEAALASASPEAEAAAQAAVSDARGKATSAQTALAAAEAAGGAGAKAKVGVVAAPPKQPASDQATVYDLSSLRPTFSANAMTSSRGSPTDVVDAGSGVDETRRNIAYVLLGVLAAIILFHFWRSGSGQIPCTSTNAALCVAQEKFYSTVSSETQTIFTAIIGLVGSVVGFYFGSQSRQVPPK